MKTYTVTQAFKLLKNYKITTQEESVRRWLREGTIQGIPPQSRKEGWAIPEDNLFSFIQSRMPEQTMFSHPNVINDVNDKEAIRADMWWELARKYIFEGAIEPKRKQIKACVEHKRYSSAFEKDAWDIISRHTMGYAKPHIPYLLDAFLFDGKRIRMDHHYEGRDERILYALLEHFRQEKVEGKNKE